MTEFRINPYSGYWARQISEGDCWVRICDVWGVKSFINKEEWEFWTPVPSDRPSSVQQDINPGRMCYPTESQ